MNINDLMQATEDIKKLQKFPPYYRCNQRAYDEMKRHFQRRVPMEEFPAHMRHLSGVVVVVDNSVEDGKFLPPEDWSEK